MFWWGMLSQVLFLSFYFFFNHTATTEIYTLSLHDALPIFFLDPLLYNLTISIPPAIEIAKAKSPRTRIPDRKSTRLNSSHVRISYAVFCLKKKKHNSSNKTYDLEPNLMTLCRVSRRGSPTR